MCIIKVNHIKQIHTMVSNPKKNTEKWKGDASNFCRLSTYKSTDTREGVGLRKWTEMT